MNQILEKTKKDMNDALNLIKEDLKGIKTGRAKPSLVEELEVNVYDSKMTLKELASITASDAHTLVVSPWDKNILKEIEKAIATSDLNLHPIVANDIIRIKIPKLTQETREDLVKLVGQKIESGRRLIRQVRTDAKREIEELEGESGVSEDDIKDLIDKLQEITDQIMEKLENIGKNKEKELMQI